MECRCLIQGVLHPLCWERKKQQSHILSFRTISEKLHHRGSSARCNSVRPGAVRWHHIVNETVSCGMWGHLPLQLGGWLEAGQADYQPTHPAKWADRQTDLDPDWHTSPDKNLHFAWRSWDETDLSKPLKQHCGLRPTGLKRKKNTLVIFKC